jgi:hypothetical protein
MSYLPVIPPVVIPPRQMQRDTDWNDFIKRYMADHPTFRDSLRKWIVATNATVDDHETRIDALETGGGGTGDVVGPAGAVDRNIPVFDGVTGKLIRDSGVSMDDVVTAMSQAANALSRGKVVALDIGNSFL